VFVEYLSLLKRGRIKSQDGQAHATTSGMRRRKAGC
jgi:hypothetical protein